MVYSGSARPDGCFLLVEIPLWCALRSVGSASSNASAARAQYVYPPCGSWKSCSEMPPSNVCAALMHSTKACVLTSSTPSTAPSASPLSIHLMPIAHRPNLGSVPPSTAPPSPKCSPKLPSGLCNLLDKSSFVKYRLCIHEQQSIHALGSALEGVGT